MEERVTTRAEFQEISAELPRRVEVLYWQHAKEHVNAAAHILYGGTERSAHWRNEHLDRLWDDGVDDVIALRFLGPHQRSAVKRTAVDDLHRYFTTSRKRMRSRTFREAGYQIGSAAAEGAIGHVIQQRVRRVGMRWETPGATPR